MIFSQARIQSVLLEHAPPLVLLATVYLTFGWNSPQFRSAQTAENISVQCSSVAVVAAGMTVVLLTGGIDLSAGSIMFLSAAVAGKLAVGLGLPVPLAIAAALAVGLLFGAVNAGCIAWLGMIPFIVTLATQFVGRGLGLWLTETRDLKLPETFLQIGQSRLLLPMPLVILIAVVIALHVVLRHTPFGRMIYAMGQDSEAARKAGINTRRMLFSVYVLSGLCAALGGLVAVAQLGTVAAKLGEQREFSAIAAAVIGGTSLFGGKGSVLPGTLVGAVLMQAIDAGLVMRGADPYLFPIVASAIIFLAVLIDQAKHLARAA